MIILNAVQELIHLNYNFFRAKFRLKFNPPKPESKYQELFHDLTVLNGPFKGLRYIGFDAICSTIFPKLLGSYEKEIQEDVLEIVARRPKLVIDIGCAEGYYAVGVARLLPEAKVVAADTFEPARELCIKAARLNNCENITVTGAITANSLITHPLDNALIICDCEGFEGELFTPENVCALRSTNLIIETHDFIDPTISLNLERLFASTHEIKVVSSMDDLLKAKYYKFKELDQFSLKERREILAEYRPTIMEWLVLTPKQV